MGRVSAQVVQSTPNTTDTTNNENEDNFWTHTEELLQKAKLGDTQTLTLPVLEKEISEATRGEAKKPRRYRLTSTDPTQILNIHFSTAAAKRMAQ